MKAPPPSTSPRQKRLSPSGAARQSTATNFARRESGDVAPASCKRSSTRRIARAKSLSGPAHRAEYMPGSPPSASTARPESSASAGRPVAFAAAVALIAAFSSNVAPVSSGSSIPISAAEIASIPNGPISSAELMPWDDCICSIRSLTLTASCGVGEKSCAERRAAASAAAAETRPSAVVRARIYFNPSFSPFASRATASRSRRAFVSSRFAASIQPTYARRYDGASVSKNRHAAGTALNARST